MIQYQYTKPRESRQHSTAAAISGNINGLRQLRPWCRDTNIAHSGKMASNGGKENVGRFGFKGGNVPAKRSAAEAKVPASKASKKQEKPPMKVFEEVTANRPHIVTVAQLRKLLKVRGLDTTGNKAELEARLTEDDTRKESEASAGKSGSGTEAVRGAAAAQIAPANKVEETASAKPRPASSTDRDYDLYQMATKIMPADDMDEWDKLLNARFRGKKFDLKKKCDHYERLIPKLKETLNKMRQQRIEFYGVVDEMQGSLNSDLSQLSEMESKAQNVQALRKRKRSC